MRDILTDAKIQKYNKLAIKNKKEITVSDLACRGLYLRCFVGGHVAFYLSYRAKGHNIRKVLGDYPSLGLEEARQKIYLLKNADIQLHLISQLQQQQKEAHDGINGKKITLKALITEQLEIAKHSKRSNTYSNYARVAQLLDYPIFNKSVRLLVIDDYLDFYKEASQKYSEFLFFWLDTLITAAGKRCLIDYKLKFEKIKFRELTNKKQSIVRARVDEQDTFKMIDIVLSSEHPIYIKLQFLFQLLTMVRPVEAQQTRIAEFVGDYWIIPKERMKTNVSIQYQSLLA